MYNRANVCCAHIWLSIRHDDDHIPTYHSYFEWMLMLKRTKTIQTHLTYAYVLILHFVLYFMAFSWAVCECESERECDSAKVIHEIFDYGEVDASHRYH